MSDIDYGDRILNKDIKSALEKVQRIDIKDENNNYKKVDDVLKELSAKWEPYNNTTNDTDKSWEYVGKNTWFYIKIRLKRLFKK